MERSSRSHCLSSCSPAVARPDSQRRELPIRPCRVSVDPSEVSAKIVGATPKQETILRAILAGLGRETRIKSVHVIRPEERTQTRWPCRPARRAGRRRAQDWEVSLLANAFAARSRAVHLQRVAELFVNGESDSSLDAGDPVEPRDPVSADALSGRDLRRKEERCATSRAPSSASRQLRARRQASSRRPGVISQPSRGSVPLDGSDAGCGSLRRALPPSRRREGHARLVVFGHRVGRRWRNVVGYIRPELAGCEPIHSFGGSPFRRPPPPCPVKTPGEPSDQNSPSDVTTKIVGATPRQEEILRASLSGVGDERIKTIAVEEPESGWGSSPGDVALRFSPRAEAAGRHAPSGKLG